MSALPCRFLGLLALFFAFQPARAQDTAQAQTGKPASNVQELSDAEKILHVETTFVRDSRELENIKKQRSEAKEQYTEAEATFKRLDDEWTQLRTEKSTAKPKVNVESLKLRRQLAGTYFDLVFKERQTLEDLSKVLSLKNEQTRTILKQLNRPTDLSALEQVKRDKESEAKDKHEDKDRQEKSPPAKEADKSGQSKNLLQNPLDKFLPRGISLPSAQPDEEVNAADQEVQAREKAARLAEAKVKLLDTRKKYLLSIIDLEQKLLDLEQKKADNVAQQLKLLNQELQKAVQEKRPATGSLKNEVAAAEKRGKQSHERVQTVTARLTDLHHELTRLENAITMVARDAGEKQSAVQEARRNLANLSNPYTWHNIMRWLLIHGPRILVIVLTVAVLQFGLRFFGKRIVKLMTRQRIRGTLQERENRAHTLVGVFRNTASALILAGGIIMVLQEIGIPVMPLLGSAAVLGLAVAFGAQNLIKDYFYGFMVLLEDQYGVGDVIKIAGISGQVERITLRITVLRDSDGTAHFVPHSSITTVSNMSHGWAAAFLEIPIGIHEDVERVIEVIQHIGAELRRDPKLGPAITGDLEMAGLDRLDSSGNAIIQFSMKTLPLKQWDVKRELLRRIKNKLSELDIELAYPQRTVHLREEGANGADVEKSLANARATGDGVPRHD